MSGWIRTVAVAATVILALGATACGEDDPELEAEPAATVTEDDSGEPTEEPEPAETEEPEEPTGPPDFTIKAMDNEFVPARVPLKPGKYVVRVVNKGNNAHTFFSQPLGVESGMIRSGTDYLAEIEFKKEAANFVCTIHLDMRGEFVPKK